jgi:hypothetical protein
VSGETAQQGLDAAISGKLPDNDKGSIESKGYVRESTTDFVHPDPPLGAEQDGGGNPAYLAQFGIDASTTKGWETFQISNEPLSLTPIEQYAVSYDQKTFIVKEAYTKERDANRQPGAADPSNVMMLRDMNMDSWRVAAAATHGDVKQLDWIVRNDIVTTESQAAIDASFQKVGIDPSLVGTYRSTATDPGELAAYQEIAGTPHGQGIIKMLSDHHTELGDLRVIAFHAFTKQSSLSKYYAIVAELGRP